MKKKATVRILATKIDAIHNVSKRPKGAKGHGAINRDKRNILVRSGIKP